MIDTSYLLNQLSDGATVVVPDASFAGNLKKRFARRASRSSPVWQTPPIYAWKDWLRHLWSQHQQSTDDWRIVLNELQQRLLWQQVIVQDIRENANTVLWNLSASINQAIKAWELVHEYQIDLSVCPYLTNDTKVFLRWQNTYCRYLNQHQWIDPKQLAQELISCGSKMTEDAVEFWGFIDFTPLQTDLIAALFSKPAPAPEFCKAHAANPVVYEFTDIESELTACANWARETYESGSDLTIGIFVADLENSRNKVESLFKSIFVPDFALGLNQTDVFVLTQGNRLSDSGIIESALNCLCLLAPRFDYERFSRYLRDGNINRSEQVKHELCLLDVKLRGIVTEDASLAELVNLLDRIEAADLSNIGVMTGQLRDVRAFMQQADKSASVITWCGVFTAVLKLLNWPDYRHLSSLDRQLLQQWDQLIATVCTAGLVCQQLDFEEAFGLFMHAAASTMVKNPQARITIADISASGGMRFDAAWVCGLNDTVLPGPVAFNPLLPFDVQREKALPYSSAEDCRIRADALFNQLSALADAPRLSFYKNDEHLIYRPSRYLAEYPVTSAQPLEQRLSGCPDNAVFEHYKDDRGMPLEDSSIAGGAYLLKSQAQCPFKAYAEKRLGVTPIQKSDLGLNPAERGSLVHSLMQKLWKILVNRSTLLATPKTQLEELIRKQAGDVVASLAHSQNLFAHIESKRLQDLAMDWLMLESKRAMDFRVILLEHPLTYSCSGIDFEFKVDRIDELEDGSLMIIDYKTGNASKSAWLDPRVQDPQMPAYFVALGGKVGAICYANTKKLAFDGISERDLQLSGVNHVENTNNGKLKNFKDWDQLVEHWNQVIVMLANEIKEGVASVTPESPADCRYCGRQSLCRISQHQSLLLDDDL